MSSSRIHDPRRKALALTFPRSLPRERTRLHCPHCDAQALIRAIVCPVLFIRGEQGFPGLLAQWQLREAAFGHIERVTVAGGHHFHMENSSETAVYIENFAQIR